MSKKLLKNIDVELISILELPAKPANMKPLIFKSSDNKLEMQRVIKVDAEKGLLYCTVMACDEVDTDGEMVSADEVRKAAHNFLKKSDVKRIDKNHNLVVNNKVQIVESYVDNGGNWQAVIDIADDANLVKAAKEGKLTGVSIFGTAEAFDMTEKSKKDDDDARSFIWSAAFEKLDRLIDKLSFGGNKNIKKKEGDIVTDEEINGIVDKVVSKLTEKYDLKPKENSEDTQKNDDAVLKQEIADLKKSVETLAASRMTNEDAGAKKVTFEDLLNDGDALLKMQKDDPVKYEELRQGYYAQ